ncbi:MAG TPA: hypothetical protein VHE30_29495 [Polyangiaceae bacterium]|nr:hypothetical protein [Polyangiaceae bacterium]
MSGPLRAARSGAALVLAAATACGAAERQPLSPLVPNFTKFQSGGYLGFLTIGAGYAVLREHLTVAGYVGWVPAGLGGKTIVTPAFGVSYRPVRVELDPERSWWPLYVGIGGVFGTGGRFPVFTADPFPPPGLRFLAHLGTELRVRLSRAAPLESHGPFVEVTALDKTSLLWLDNREGPGFWQIWSTTVGYKAAF